MLKSEKHTLETSAESNTSQKIWVLFMIGLAIILTGTVMILAPSALSGGDSVSSGMIIFIGPLPIVVGAGLEARWMILFAVILAVLSVIMFLAMRRRLNREID